MYRLVDVTAWFNYLAQKYTFSCEDLKLALKVTDSFVPENEQTYHLQVKKGELVVGESLEKALVLELAVTELSALMIGSVKLESLYRLGKVNCAEGDVPKISKFFELPSPQCITSF